MRIGSELPATNPADAGGTASIRAPKANVSQDAPPSGAPKSPASSELQKPANEQSPAPEALSLSFRKDSNGRTYYVLTDPQSGQIVREVPPEEIRQVGQGIEDYLKSQAALTARRTDSKA